tara:strand:+ start:946 stop:1254 length:309 start_codon:yes stop_codon:yes gene_type:complete
VDNFGILRHPTIFFELKLSLQRKTVMANAKTVLTLAQAAQLIPHRPGANTLWRWSAKGINGVKLQTFKVGRSRCTTAAMLAEFVRNSGLPADCDISTDQFEL